MYDFRDELGVPEALLDALTESQLITESYAKLHRTSVRLYETVHGGDDASDAINEANAAPNEVIVGNKVIKLETFRDVWTDYDKYWDLDQILMGLGLTYDDFGKQGRRSATRKFWVLVKRAYEQGYLDRKVTLNGREEAYSNLKEKNRLAGKTGLSRDPEDEDPDDVIDGGSRGPDNSPTGRTIYKLNDTNVLPGEFYSNISHIPKTTQRAWWKLWSNKTRRVPNENGKWRKSFIMGYQVDRNTVFEVWYNSIDSTFTVHNHRGIQISKRYPTVKETMTGMLDMIRTYSEKVDPTIRGANGNVIFQSVARSLSQDVANSSQLKKLSTLERQDRRRAERQEQMRKKKAETSAKNGKVTRPLAKPRIATAAEKEELGAMWDQDGPSTAERKKQEWIDKLDAENERTRQAAIDAKDRKEKRDRDYQARMDGLRKEDDNRKRLKQEKERQEAEKRRKAQEKIKAEREKELKAQRELEGDDGDIPSPEEADQLPLGANDDSGRMPKKKKNRTTGDAPPLRKYDDFDQIDNYYGLDESMENLFASNSAQALNEEVDPNNLAEYYRRIGRIQAREEQQNAKKSSYTKAVLNSSDLGSLIESYDETRVRSSNWFVRNFTRIFNGRRRNSNSPDIDFSSTYFKILKTENNGNSFIANKCIADFLIGFSLKGLVDIEIWYVSEPNPNQNKRDDDPLPEMISSYYVYDVTAKTLLRSYLPYYRNAIHVAVDKLSPAMDSAKKTKKGYQ